jgi:hypothetical protein
MRIYIACALTAVPRTDFVSYVHFIHSLAGSLKDNCFCNVKYALINSDPQLAFKPAQDRARLCYHWDRDMVLHSDVIVADATYPSTGLGIELQIADSANIPIILCYRNSVDRKLEPVYYNNPDHSHHLLQIGEGFISLMALGLPSVYKTIPYSDYKTVIKDVSDTVNEIKIA